MGSNFSHNNTTGQAVSNGALTAHRQCSRMGLMTCMCRRPSTDATHLMTCKHVMTREHVEIWLKVWFFTVAKSKLDETCFVVISSESIQTRSTVSNWVAIQIWKIKYRKHVNSLPAIRGLERFRGAKTASQFGHVKDWFKFRSKSKVCCTQLKLQLLLKVKLHI